MGRRRKVEYESVSSRRGIFVVMFSVSIICATTYILLSRLSNDSLSMLIGLAVGGFLVALPIALGVFAWVKSRQFVQQSQTMMPPTYIIQNPQTPQQNPQSLPDYGGNYPQLKRTSQRSWEVVGADSDEN